VRKYREFEEKVREGVVLSGDWEREKRREEGLFALEGDKRHLNYRTFLLCLVFFIFFFNQGGEKSLLPQKLKVK